MRERTKGSKCGRTVEKRERIIECGEEKRVQKDVKVERVRDEREIITEL